MHQRAQFSPKIIQKSLGSEHSPSTDSRHWERYFSPHFDPWLPSAILAVAATPLTSTSGSVLVMLVLVVDLSRRTASRLKFKCGTKTVERETTSSTCCRLASGSVQLVPSPPLAGHRSSCAHVPGHSPPPSIRPYA